MEIRQIGDQSYLTGNEWLVVTPKIKKEKEKGTNTHTTS